MAETASLAVWDALSAAINQGGASPVGPDGKPILGTPRVYRGKVPASRDIVNPTTGAVQGYFLFGGDPEEDTEYYHEAGEEGVYTIHCWCDTKDNATRLYQWLKRLVHERILALDGHTMISGRMSKGGSIANEGEDAWQVPADYRTETLEAA
jgi:hypothetical protein